MDKGQIKMTHDYKKPLQELKRKTSPHRTTSFEALGIIVSENMPAIMHALELAIALQPKLISEAPRNGAQVLLYSAEYDSDGVFDIGSFCCIAHTDSKAWVVDSCNAAFLSPSDEVEKEVFGISKEAIKDIVKVFDEPTHFYDISALPKPEEKTK